MVDDLAQAVQQPFTSFIDGTFVQPTGVENQVVDPASGEDWATMLVDQGDVDHAVQAAHKASFNSEWRRNATARSTVLRNIASLIEESIELLAKYETLATGKPIASTRVEIGYAANWYRYYASVLETERDDFVTLSATKNAVIVNEPVGVVGAITPFNGAFSLGTWKFAPALAAGNSIIVKPPLESSASTLHLARIMRQSGVPVGIFNVVLGDVEAGRELVSDERVSMVTFTGSSAVGQNVGATVTGRMGRFVCEAGGKSAHIVMDDADLESAVIAAAQGVFSGSGQTCVAGSRLLVHKDIYEKFTKQFIDHSKQITVGDPMSDVHLGPIATKRQYQRIHNLINEALQEKATVLLDGRNPQRQSGSDQGLWIGPTILTDAKTDSAICQTEVFGPVVVIQKVDSFEEAIEVANATEYGLAAGIWTKCQARANEAANRLVAGTVWINTYRGMDWRTPFGGYKKSGIGRENGLESLEEFRQVKTIVQDFATAVDPFGIVK